MRVNLQILWLALLMFSFVSCKKDGDSSAPTKMSAVIDGKAWDSSVRVSVLQGGYFTITGTSLTGEVIAFTIKGEATGTYNLSVLPPVAQCGASYKASPLATTEDIYASVSGKVVLSKVDKTAKLISGTFEFTLTLPSNLTSVKSITSGQFNDLEYQVYQ